jgi:Asp-tRNA(Asn)/Glu-tRNA(Gln) amidotransferase C subunit
VIREDAEPHETGKFTDALLAAAPKTKNGFIAVKKIL